MRDTSREFRKTERVIQNDGLIIFADLLQGNDFMRPIARFLGADAEVLEDCVLYGRILMASNTFFMMQNAFQSFMVAAEKPHFGLVISIATGVTNMVLDFLLVYVFPF